MFTTRRETMQVKTKQIVTRRTDTISLGIVRATNFLFSFPSSDEKESDAFSVRESAFPKRRRRAASLRCVDFVSRHCFSATLRRSSTLSLSTFHSAPFDINRAADFPRRRVCACLHTSASGSAVCACQIFPEAVRSARPEGKIRLRTAAAPIRKWGKRRDREVQV